MPSSTQADEYTIIVMYKQGQKEIIHLLARIVELGKWQFRHVITIALCNVATAYVSNK